MNEFTQASELRSLWWGR